MATLQPEVEPIDHSDNAAAIDPPAQTAVEGPAEYDTYSDYHEDVGDQMNHGEFEAPRGYYENFQPTVESAAEEELQRDPQYSNSPAAYGAVQGEVQGQYGYGRPTGHVDQESYHRSAPGYVERHDGAQELYGANPFQGQPAGEFKALFDAIDASSQAAFQGSEQTAEQSVTDAITSSASDLYRCSDRGLQIALKNFLSRHKTPVAKRAAKDEKYVKYIAERRQQLEGKLRIAEDIWDECKRDREANTDPRMTGMLSFEFSRADLKYQRAKRDYEMFVSELKEIAQLPLMSRDDMEVASLHRKKKYDDLRAQDIEEDLLSSTDTWKLEIGKALERSRELEQQLASTSKLLEEAREDASDLKQIVQNLKDDKLKSEVQLTGEFARRAHEFNEVSEQIYMLEETCYAQAEHIRVLEQQLDMLRFGGARSGSETVADDLKEAHDEQFGLTQESDEANSKSRIHAPTPYIPYIRSFPLTKYAEPSPWVNSTGERATGDGEFASFDGSKRYYSLADQTCTFERQGGEGRKTTWANPISAHASQSDSAEEPPVTPTVAADTKATALDSQKQQSKRRGNVDLHDPDKCQWHAQGACRILSPISQKRTGKFCKVTEPEQK